MKKREPKTKFYKFKADRIIEAKSLKEAQDIFCDESWDFASDADVEEFSTFEDAMRG